MATSSASLAKPGNRQNWIEATPGGGLPPGVRKVARKLKQLHPEWSLSRCIATAISRSKVWAAGGSAKGARNTAAWEALKAKNKARQVSAAHPAYEGAVLQLAHAYGADAVPSLSSQVLDLAAPLDEVTGHWLDLAAPAVESTEGREKARRKGMALPDRSFPVPDVAHLRKAMTAYGRGTSPEKRKKIVALIRRAAGKLGVAQEKWVTDWLSEHSGGTRKDEVAAAEPADDVAWLDLADKVTAESLRLARVRAKELGKEEKPAKGSKSGFNEAAHPRAGAGSAAGGQFVAAGAARNAEGAEAQKDKTAADNSAKLQQGKVDPAKLTDEQLQKLSRYVYSWKSSDPKVVAARVKVAAELRKRGMDPGKFGSLAGKGATPKPKPKPPPKPAPPKPARTGTVAAAQHADMVAWLDLATRYVRTKAGADRYNRPIGSPIGTWPDAARGGGRAPKVRTGADFVRSALKGRATRQVKTSAAADRLSGLDAKTRAGVLGKATAPQLAAMDAEFSRRATSLGKPGQVSKAHADVQAARAARRKPSTAPTGKPAADDRLAKLTPAQRDAVLAVRAKRAAQQGKPAPAPKSPDALSDAELDTALSESKVRLRAAFDKDRTRKGQEFVAAEQHATGLATEKRRRNVAAGAKPVPLSPAERAKARLAEQQRHAEETAQRRAAATPKAATPRTRGDHPIMGQLRAELAAKLQQDREASQRRKAAAPAERPQPDMSNVDQLSNDELTSRLAAAQTRLREAKQADPRRVGQGYADAKLNRDVLTAEMIRRTGPQDRTPSSSTPAPGQHTGPGPQMSPEFGMVAMSKWARGASDADLAAQEDALQKMPAAGMQSRAARGDYRAAITKERRQRADTAGSSSSTPTDRTGKPAPWGLGPTGYALDKPDTDPRGNPTVTDAMAAARRRKVPPKAAEVLVAALNNGGEIPYVKGSTTGSSGALQDRGYTERVRRGASPESSYPRLTEAGMTKARELAAEQGGRPPLPGRRPAAAEQPTPAGQAFPTGPRPAANVAPGMVIDTGDEQVTVASVERGAKSTTVDLVDTNGGRHTYGTGERARVVGGTRPGGADALLGMGSAAEQRAAAGRMSTEELRAVDDELTSRGSVSGARRAVAERLAATVDDRRPLEALAADESKQGTRRTAALDIGAAVNARAVSGTPENIAARQQARARGASQPSMFAGEEEQKLSDAAVRSKAAGTLFGDEDDINDEAAAIAEMAPRRTASTRAAQAELQRAQDAVPDLPAHLTTEQRQVLTRERAAADKAWAAARKVFAETESATDAATKRRRGRAAQKAADARDLYDRDAKTFGAPPLPPLQRTPTRPAAPTPRGDETAITTAKQELAEVSARAVANASPYAGRRMGRGKQALQRGDAQLRRAAQFSQQTEQVKARLRALGVPDAEIKEVIDAAWARAERI